MLNSCSVITPAIVVALRAVSVNNVNRTAVIRTIFFKVMALSSPVWNLISSNNTFKKRQIYPHLVHIEYHIIHQYLSYYDLR